MVTTEAAVPARVRPAKLALRFLTAGVLSAAVACFVVGAVASKWSVVGIGGALVLAAYVVAVAREVRRQNTGADAKPAPPATLTALAKIESRRATGGESGDVPVEFDLTVAPEEGPAFRVKASRTVNLVDIPDYPPGRVLLVEYREDQPWRLSFVEQPGPEWEPRLAGAALDSAPETTRLTPPKPQLASCALVFAGMAVGAVAVVLLFHADLS